MNKQKSYQHPPKNPNFFVTENYFLLCNLGTPNSAAMGCSQPKLSRTGLRNILAFLKVDRQHFLGGTWALLPRSDRHSTEVALSGFHVFFDVGRWIGPIYMNCLQGNILPECS